ncbi:transposase [Cytobacillus purgationiresistens]|uniref:REP element-mobilizing transposase RayT n=1 Tax=Cytobacillus purgationiresistens TaxID=863449 RepID=A0ABU0ADU7_9BACI|nr:transposase [Cytobacillus purgationiresistens]MDQ0269220.1 REP element-mobilizing transposase RayT [Cytobacillus purgationiresistens]
MARSKRIWSPEHFHHVGNRGNWQMNLFREEQDYFVFLKILQRTYELTKMEICSYCLMSNHYHLLIRTPHVPLSKVMSRINKGYTDYFNRKYEVSGHLFEKRFFSKPVYDDYGLLEVSSYIHLNPVEAQMATNLARYRWSSYHYYHSPYLKHPEFFNPFPLAQSFPGDTIHQKKEVYCKWLHKDYKLEHIHGPVLSEK